MDSKTQDESMAVLRNCREYYHQIASSMMFILEVRTNKDPWMLDSTEKAVHFNSFSDKQILGCIQNELQNKFCWAGMFVNL